jgi:hypothetical protein
MDVYQDWFDDTEIHRTIASQVHLWRDSMEWESATPPGITMIIDDHCVLETNDAGQFRSF